MKSFYYLGQKGFLLFMQKSGFLLKKLKLYQLKFTFLLLSLIITSCSWFSQDPLQEKVSKELQEGVLQTGPENWTLFDPVLVDQILKIEIKGQKDLSMNFKEGEERSYSIQFRFFNDFDQKYEILMDDNVFKNSLEGSKWSYQTDQLVGTLSWKPRHGFSHGRMYQSFNIPFSVKLKKKDFPDQNQILTIDRQVRVYVDKKVIATFIRKVSVKSDVNVQTYIQMDDKKFYRSDGLSHLDLSYYDDIFLSVLKSNDMVSSGENEVISYQDLFSSKENMMMYPIVGLLDRQKSKINEAIIPFIQQSYYYSTDKKSECDGKSFCLLEDRSSVLKDTSLYVKVYKKPETISPDQIYYKMESPFLCQVNYKKSADYIVNNLPDEKANYKEECYLALESFRDSLEELRESDESNIYLLNNQKLEKLKLSNWPVLFKKIPEFVKWNLGGHKPIKDNMIPVQMQYNEGLFSKTLIFEIEDQNGYLQDVQLIRDRKLYQKPYWSFPVSWSLVDVQLRSLDKIVELSYSLVAKETTYQSQPIDLTAFSQTIAGDTVSIKLTLLPLVQIDETHQFDFEQDAVLDQSFKESLGQREWIESSLKLNKQIDRTYIFPKDFYSHLPSYKVSSRLESFKNHINLNSILAESDYCQTGESCVCSDFSFYQKEKSDDNIYAKSQCVYNTQVDFNRESEDRSVYVQQRHSLVTPLPIIGLKQTNAVGRSIKDQTVEVSENFYRLTKDSSREPFDPKSIFSESLFHIFFDLQPEFICDSIKDDIKNCTIRYLFETKERAISLPQWNDQETGLLSALNIQCLETSSSGTKKCNCQSGLLNVDPTNKADKKYSPYVGVVVSKTGTKPLQLFLDFKCAFSAKKGSFSVEWFLETDHPNIFLLNKTNQNLKQTLSNSYTIIQGAE